MKENTYTPECCANCPQDRSSQICTDAPTRCRKWKKWFHEHWTRIQENAKRQPKEKEEET